MKGLKAATTTYLWMTQTRLKKVAMRARERSRKWGTSILHALNTSSTMNLATRWRRTAIPDWMVLEDSEDSEVSGSEDTLGPEDGENLDDRLEYTELRCSYHTGSIVSHQFDKARIIATT